MTGNAYKFQVIVEHVTQLKTILFNLLLQPNFVSGSVKSYTTSGSKNLSVGSVSDVLKIPVDGKSIITFVGNYQ